MTWYFVSDLHGRTRRYTELFRVCRENPPDVLCVGGDIYPSGFRVLRAGDASIEEFHTTVLLDGFRALRGELGSAYPRVFLIPGNDDPAVLVDGLLAGEYEGLWHYAQQRTFDTGSWVVAGYSYVTPSPFRLKDWERYDVSRYVDPGCIPPEQGLHTVPVEAHRIVHATIADDLQELALNLDAERLVLLAHVPPYGGALDRAALDGVKVDHAPVDVHVGSIALRRWIERRQPRVTLHGHIHESARLTGSWRETIGSTHAFGAAHDGPELALIRFDPAVPASAERLLL